MNYLRSQFLSGDRHHIIRDDLDKRADRRVQFIRRFGDRCLIGIVRHGFGRRQLLIQRRQCVGRVGFSVGQFRFGIRNRFDQGRTVHRHLGIFQRRFSRRYLCDFRTDGARRGRAVFYNRLGRSLSRFKRVQALHRILAFVFQNLGCRLLQLS